MWKKVLLPLLQVSHGLALFAEAQIDAMPPTASGLNEIISISIPQQSSDTTTHHISVGGDNDLTFVPNRINANLGDRIAFQFRSGNHSLTQSSLEKPCVSSEQFDSGFNQFNTFDENDLTLTFTVNTLAPQWFFCRQNRPVSHCHAGMVFAVNPGNLMDKFLSNAISHASSTVVVTETKTVTSFPSPSQSASVPVISIRARSTGSVKSPTNPVSTAPGFTSGGSHVVFLWSFVLFPLLSISAFMWLI